MHVANTTPVNFPRTVEVAALRRCRLFVSDDVDEARDRISKILQPHTLLPIGYSGRRLYHMDVIELPGIWINAIGFGEACIRVPPLDFHVVIFCLSGRAWMRSGEVETDIGPHRAIACSPGRPLDGTFSRDCEQIVVRINRCALEAHTGARNVTMDPVIDIDNRFERPWLMHLNSLVASPELLRMVQSDRKIATNYASLLIRTLVTGHRQKSLCDKASIQCAAPACVYRAEAFIAAHAPEAITLQDIAIAARAPVRTLLHGFRKFRETTPMQFLRSFRLTQARDQILQDMSRSIASIALECGFGNLGRFSSEYATKFGELPSETRTKGRNGQPGGHRVSQRPRATLSTTAAGPTVGWQPGPGRPREGVDISPT